MGRLSHFFVGQLYDRALRLRDEKEIVDSVIVVAREAAKRIVDWDRATFIANKSIRLAHAAENGLSPKSSGILVKDISGVQTGNKQEQAQAFKVYLAKRSHGRLSRFSSMW